MLHTIITGALLSLVSIVAGEIMVYTQETPPIVNQEFRDMPASFGGDLPPEGLSGLLVKANPSNGCTTLQNPPTVENFTGKWIVLVARYNCSFEVKVRNAQLAGYDCVIVHNVASDELETMSAKDSTGIVIPSVFVSAKAGLILAEQCLYDTGSYIMVNGDLPFDINTHLLLPFAIIVVLCLLVILIFMIVKCIRDRRQARRHRLPSRSLKKIPTCKFRKGDPYDTCAICLDDYQEGERLRVLPCAHAYHALCIDPWLTQNKRVCPVCKRRVFVAGERRHVHHDSDSSDTEPLLNDDSATQGGTFDEQQENPFMRAARFMTRLRRDPPPPSPDQSPREDVDQSINSNEDTRGDDDRQPLVQAAVATVSERRRRRRARSASARAAARHPAPAPAPADTPPLLHSDRHSINYEGRGEIGVPALTATPLATSAPHHVNL
ncbi:unnamed protein product [Arctia plantaginis]|uniref:RING-type E3 ubiquitin transferase n=1 Tax=Arctia plantaginis TaxID=874455 RepID=A0A8S0YNH3_ARCPL|nr:unnamed protein product [Arctia plantaginis]